MSLKLFIFLTTSALLVYGNDVERKDNAESYITKEAAKELNKLSLQGKQQDHAYEDILEQFLSVQQSGDDENEDETFEKKYFDYLPNEVDSEDEDTTREFLKPHNARIENVRRVNSRRFKRDLQNRQKRQSIYYYPLVHYSQSPHVDFYYPQELRYFAPVQSRFDSPSPNPSYNSNPFHPNNNDGKFHQPGNFYLPPSRPGQNVPSPPHNPTKPPIDVGDRVAGFEGEDDPFYFGEGPRPNVIQPDRKPSYTTTARPSYNEPNNLDFPGGNAEVDIEYPPDIFDPNVKLTTRAPLIRPTSNASKTPSRNRQRKPAATTTTPPPTTARFTTRQPDRTSNSRKQNTSVPACVLAIVNCCSRYNDIVPTPCFERFNCNASFFGQKACSADIKASAFREVEKFSRK